MKLSVNQGDLTAALAITGRAVNNRTTMPVLFNTLLDADDNTLRLASTNREMSITTWIGASVDDSGSVTIPARLLSEFVGSLPPEQVHMDLIERTISMHFECGRHTANMRGIDAYEFPLLPTLPKGEPTEHTSQYADVDPVAVDPSVLCQMIARVAFAASADENRPTLTGVEFSIDNHGLKMAATDGFRLSVAQQSVDNDNASCSAIVPSKSLFEVARIAKDARTVDVYVTNSTVLFAMTGNGSARWQRVELVSELIDARFPDYNAAIPTAATTTATVNTKELQQGIRVSMLYARDNSNIIRFSIGDSAIKLSATSAEGGDSLSDIQCETTGDGVEIALNGKYLLDVLPELPDLVQMELTTPVRPALLHGGNQSEFLHVVMPMHIPR